MAQFTRKNYEFRPENYIRDDGSWDKTKMAADARKAAKSSNQRLVRLEKAGYTNAPAYKGAVKATSGQYNQDMAVSWGHVDKEGRPRYKERGLEKLSVSELKNMLYALGKTQSAKSSTVGAVRKLYKQGAKRLAQSSGTDFSEDDVMFMLAHDGLKEYIKQYGYKAIMQLIEEAQETGRDLSQASAYVVELLNTKGSLLEVEKEIGGKPKADIYSDDDFWNVD